MYRYNIYKPRKDGGGAATQFEMRPDADKGYVFFFSGAGQNGTEKNFNWQNKINMSLGTSDIQEMLATLQRRQDECNLFHESPGGGNKVLEIKKTDRGYSLRLSYKKEGPADGVSHAVTHGEAAALAALLEKAVVLSCYDNFSQKEK
jgi:hypothetical protein